MTKTKSNNNNPTGTAGNNEEGPLTLPFTSGVKDKFKGIMRVVLNRGFLSEMEATIEFIMEDSGHSFLTLLHTFANVKDNAPAATEIRPLNRTFKANLERTVAALIKEHESCPYEPTEVKEVLVEDGAVENEHEPVVAQTKKYECERPVRVFNAFRKLVVVCRRAHKVPKFSDKKSMAYNWKLLWTCVDQQRRALLDDGGTKLTDLKMTGLMNLATKLVLASASRGDAGAGEPHRRPGLKHAADHDREDDSNRDDGSATASVGTAAAQEDVAPEGASVLASSHPASESQGNEDDPGDDAPGDASDDPALASGSASNSDKDSGDPSSDDDDDPAPAPDGPGFDVGAQRYLEVGESGHLRVVQGHSRPRPATDKPNAVSSVNAQAFNPDSGSGSARGVEPAPRDVDVPDNERDRGHVLASCSRRDRGPPPHDPEGPRKRAREEGECARLPGHRPRRRLADDQGDGNADADAETVTAAAGAATEADAPDLEVTRLPAVPNPSVAGRTRQRPVASATHGTPRAKRSAAVTAERDDGGPPPGKKAREQELRGVPRAPAGNDSNSGMDLRFPTAGDASIDNDAESAASASGDHASAPDNEAALEDDNASDDEKGSSTAAAEELAASDKAQLADEATSASHDSAKGNPPEDDKATVNNASAPSSGSDNPAPDKREPASAPNESDGDASAQDTSGVSKSDDPRIVSRSRRRSTYDKPTIVSVHGHASVSPNSGSGASRGVESVSVNRAEELNVPGRRDQGPPPQLMEGPRKRAREVGECAREPAQQRRRLADDGGEGGGEAEDRRLLDGLHDDGSEEDERVVDAEMVVPDPAAEAGVPADSGANADGGRHTDISSGGGGAESDAERAPNKSDPPARREPTSGTVAGEQFDETEVGGSPQQAPPLGRGEGSVGGDALSETTGYFTATERWEELEDDEDAGKNSEVLATDGGNDAAAETLDGDATDLLERSYVKLDAPIVGTDCSTSSEDALLDLLRRLGEVLVPTSGVDPVPQDSRGRPDYTSLIVNPRSRLETRVLSGTSMIDVLSRLMDAAGVLLKKWLGADLGDRIEDFQRWLELQHKSRATDLTSEQRGQAARLLGAMAHLAEARREVEESIMDVGKWPNPTRVGVEVTLVEVAPHADTRAGGGGEDSSVERAGHNAAPPARRGPAAPSIFDDDDTGLDSAGEEEGVLPAPMDRGEDDGDDDEDEDDEVEGSTAGGVNVGMHDPDDDSQMKDETSDDGAAVSSDNGTNPKLDLLNLLWRLGQVLAPSSDVEVPRSVDGRPDYASLVSNPASLLEAMVLVPGASTVGVLYRMMQVVSVALEEWGHEVVADLAARARDVLWDRSRTGAIELSLDELDEAAYLLYSINLWLCTEQHGDAEGIHSLVIDLLGRVPKLLRSGVGETGGD